MVGETSQNRMYKGISDNVQGLRTGPVTFVFSSCFLRSITSASQLTQLVAGWVGGRECGRSRRPICYMTFDMFHRDYPT